MKGKGVILGITPRILPFPPEREKGGKYNQQEICQFHLLAFSLAYAEKFVHSWTVIIRIRTCLLKSGIFLC